MPEEQFNKIFSTNLNYFLNLNSKNQLDLANYVGVSATSVSNWCKGTKTPRMDKVDLICEYFKIKRSDLMEDRSKKEKEYYIDPETLKLAQDLKDNKKLSLLFDAARDAPPEDLETVHTMLLALKKKEENREN